MAIEGAAADDATDSALVAAARADPSAFEPLFRRYWDAVVRFCVYRLDSREEAEDAAIQVFANAYAALDRFPDRGDSFRAWLFTIAHHEATNRRRHRLRHPDRPLEAEAALADPGPSPEELAVFAGDLARTRVLLARLPERPRRVAELRLAGLTDAEIAGVLGIANDAVR
jgi:RNA polymerase sigma-70 factor (ECF subfamily)